MRLLFWLLVAHALCDFPLQGDFLARAKAGEFTAAGMGRGWPLFWHCLIHAGGVALVTGNIWLGLLELVWHFIIDVAKIIGTTTFEQDQVLHVISKVYLVLIVYNP